MASFDNSQIKLDEGAIPLTAADPDYPAAPEIREYQ